MIYVVRNHSWRIFWSTNWWVRWSRQHSSTHGFCCRETTFWFLASDNKRSVLGWTPFKLCLNSTDLLQCLLEARQKHNALWITPHLQENICSFLSLRIFLMLECVRINKSHHRSVWYAACSDLGGWLHPSFHLIHMCNLMNQRCCGVVVINNDWKMCTNWVFFTRCYRNGKNKQHLTGLHTDAFSKQINFNFWIAQGAQIFLIFYYYAFTLNGELWRY